MKTKLIRFPALSLAVAAMLVALNAPTSTAFAQGTAFTYQGRLNAGGSSASGTYDLQLGLFDAATNGNQVGSTVTNLAVGVTNGLFTTTIDFGPGIFTGSTSSGGSSVTGSFNGSSMTDYCLVLDLLENGN